jgi:outer membrane receptor protein involved in Fe transport
MTITSNVLLRLGAIVALLAPAAYAQTAPAAADTVKLETFTVTGSNIKGVDTEKSLPVTVVTADDFARAGLANLSDLVEMLPYSTDVTINDGGTGPNDARGDVSTINLRDLGADRTLVLLNGRRMSAYGVTPGTPPVQFVNINAIPLGAVQQVEVLRDGASAIYGSDAIGGVVNTILRKNYDKFEASTRYAAGDPAPKEFSFNLAGGKIFNAGRTGFSLVFNHYDRVGLKTSDRPYSANTDKRLIAPAPWNTVSSFNRGSSSGPYGRFTAVTDSGSGVAVPGVTAGNGQFYYNPTTGARATGAGPTAYFNSQDEGWLMPNIRRDNVFATLDHKFTATISFFGEASYYDSHSSGGFAAIPISSGTDGIIIPKTNYYSPVGVNSGVATPRNVLIRNYRVTEAGPRSYDTWSDSYRLLAGLRGSVSNSTWTWETGALYMRGHTYQENHGYISVSKFEQQLALDTPDAYNPFGAPGSNPAAAWKPFIIDLWDDGVGILTSLDAKASGEIARLPGGAISLATGGEFRRESMTQRNDPHGLADDVIAQSEQLDVSAARKVYAGFAEALVPLVGADNRLPGVDSLELRVAARYEHYKAFAATKPGASLAWRPFHDVLLRASYNEGFRAPSVVELYTPAIGRRNEGYIDTARAGQPDAVANVSKRIVTGGSPGLAPEESKSTNFGIVIDVPRVKGLTLSADVFRIRQRNQIDNSDAQDELDLDARLWAANHGSNPRVVRAAPTAADTAAGLPGVLVEVLGTYQNLSSRETEGFDLGLNYQAPATPIGRFALNSALAYASRIRTIDEKGNVTDLLRNNGDPRVKATGGVSWRWKNWGASVQERYTSDYGISASYNSPAGDPWIMDPYWVTNANVSYAFRTGPLKGLRVRVGANNLFDEAPPFYPASTAGYDSSYADPRGRMTFVELSCKF